jgi:hypothetical protein
VTIPRSAATTPRTPLLKPPAGPDNTRILLGMTGMASPEIQAHSVNLRQHIL